ncbi:MAG: CNNM domain-containing protein [Thermoguttaceae bacterium]
MYGPAVLAMLLLMLGSAFFSSAEAAFFRLNRSDRNKILAQGGRFSRTFAALVSEPEPLLAAILWGNLILNLLFFTLSTLITFSLQQQGEYAYSGLFAVGSLLAVIFFCEMLPKTISVLRPRLFVRLWTMPLATVLRVLRPLLPIFETVNRYSRKLFWPEFQAEPYLRVRDLEKAIDFTKKDSSLLRREQKVLQNIVRLSNLRAEELMRPRTTLQFLPPPVSLDSLAQSWKGVLPRIGYLFITERNSEELATAISLKQYPHLLQVQDSSFWDEHSAPVLLVPWSLPIAAVLEQFYSQKKEVAAVLNEHGETIGVLTIEDIWDTIYGRDSGRSRRLLNRSSIHQTEPGVWLVTGLTGLQRLERRFDCHFDSQSSVTVAGLLQEHLERFPQQGDVCQLGRLEFRVVQIGKKGELLVEIRQKVGGSE